MIYRKLKIHVLLECLQSEEDSAVRKSIADALGEIGFDALDSICAAWEDFAGEEAQGYLASILYTLATIDPEEKKNRDSEEN